MPNDIFFFPLSSTGAKRKTCDTLTRPEHPSNALTWQRGRKKGKKGRETEEGELLDNLNGKCGKKAEINASGQKEGFGKNVWDSDGMGGKAPPANCSSVEATAAGARQRQACPTSTPAPPHFLFSYPFSSCHSKCYSQLVKVHYTLSSWPEIYAPRRLRRAREGCNPLRLMTVHVSRQEAWIFLTRLDVD